MSAFSNPLAPHFARREGLYPQLGMIIWHDDPKLFKMIGNEFLTWKEGINGDFTQSSETD